MLQQAHATTSMNTNNKSFVVRSVGHSMIIVLSFWNLSQVISAFPELDVPKVSVKASTSIIQSSGSGRQQRHLSTNELQQQQTTTTAATTTTTTGYQLIEPKSGQQYRQVDQDESSHQREPMALVSLNSLMKLNPSNRIVELQPTVSGYRQSVSTSWSARANNPTSVVQQPQTPIQSRYAEAISGKLAGKNCQRRSLSRTLRSAKALLTDNFASLKQYATTGNLVMLGSSLLAGIVPLVALVLPSEQQSAPSAQRRRAGSTAGAITERVQSILSRFNPLQGPVDSVMSWIERSVEHLPNFPHLHPQECVKRSICEAHNRPDRFGMIGLMVRLLFPANNLTITDRMDNMDYKTINKYRYAASFGQSRRLGSATNNVNNKRPDEFESSKSFDNNEGQACKEKYEDCLVSLLDVAQNLIDRYLKTNKD